MKVSLCAADQAARPPPITVQRAPRGPAAVLATFETSSPIDAMPAPKGPALAGAVATRARAARVRTRLQVTVIVAP
ncbi:MAG: hypothetical protein HY915_01705 [Desulfovibrio sp.]|nr:hypothetical protein [Desulfovibrio sp.]